MSPARQGFFWWEIDVSFYVLKVLERLGVVWDVREPSAEALVPTARRLPKAPPRLRDRGHVGATITTTLGGP